MTAIFPPSTSMYLVEYLGMLLARLAWEAGCYLISVTSDSPESMMTAHKVDSHLSSSFVGAPHPSPLDFLSHLDLLLLPRRIDFLNWHFLES